ncbi:MAG: DUF3800 domain-containing protein [Treponema sp.]|nr:DUF3800 domain-containing protein [Treponema sp.]
MTEYNMYCDESCHLEHDGINDMVIGTVYCPQEKARAINDEIRKIKKGHGILSSNELKWTRIGNCKRDVYIELVNYFFSEENLHFRALLVPEKSKLRHKQFNQTHDDFYYKMYFDMLKTVLEPQNSYNVYIDIKDTHSAEKAARLHTVLCNSKYDFSAKIIKKVQPIRSDEVEIMQITDVFVGAFAYHNRTFCDSLPRSRTKQEIVRLIQEKSGYSLEKSTLYRENKCNLFVWRARDER